MATFTLGKKKLIRQISVRQGESPYFHKSGSVGRNRSGERCGPGQVTRDDGNKSLKKDYSRTKGTKTR